MYRNKKGLIAVFGVIALLTLGVVNQTLAGFFTFSDSLGRGQADTRVRNSTNTLSNKFVTVTTNLPSSGFNTNLTLTVKGTWANNAATRALSRISLVSGRARITNSGTTVNGDGIDSGDPELDNLVIPTSACSAIELSSETLDVLDPQNQVDPYSYRYVLNIHGSDPGTALKVIWYDWLIDDGSPTNSEDLVTNGRKLAELTFVGPVDLQNYDCMVVRSQRGREFIHIVTAGSAASLPFSLTCPGDIAIECDQVLQYPDASAFQIEGGVAPYSLNFDPPIELLPDSVTNVVTVTATDANGCTTSPCQFNLIRNAASTFNGFDSPIGGVGGTCATPLRTVKRGSNLPVKFSATCGGVPITTAPRIVVKNCTTGQVLATGNAIQQTAAIWHYNVDTSLAAFSNVTLEIVVYLPGGYTQRAVIKLRG